jgi:ADP-heptose:LPS heptosyltransferase
MVTKPKTLFASVNLIGDTIAQTPAIRRYRALHPEEEIHWVIQDEPMRSLFQDMSAVAVCDQVFFDNNWERIRSMDYAGYAKRTLMDVRRAFEIGQRNSVHIAQAFGTLIGVEVPPDDILPSVPLRDEDLNNIGVPPRCLVISPKSASSASLNGFAGNKNLPWKTWPELIERFVRAGRIENHVVLLRDSDPAPEVPMCVLRLSLAWAAAYIVKACADGGAYCGVDNGLTHIAAGLRVPTFCVYPAGMADGWCGYGGFPHYRMAKTLPYRGDVDEVWAAWANRL